MNAPRVRLHGLLGMALAANHGGRLSRFITDAQSPAIALFAPERAEGNREGDWYGEHAGKWLYAASKAAARTQDAKLAANVRRIADYLVSVQRPDGYLGTYAAERRFTVKPQPPRRTWDGAPAQRTWDIWTHSYLVLGLLEAHRHFPEARYLECARRIGELCRKALVTDGIDVTHLGNHHGMSATVLLDAAMELHVATREERFLELAKTILSRAEARPELNLLSRALAGADAADIGTGKAYQLLWNLVGLAKLHRATGEARLLTAVLNTWTSVRERHLTLGGGPWGGVALRSREIFSPAGAFSPYGYVETCSTFSWMQLNRILLELTGEARFAEEIERSAYNDLLGAQAPNGEDWCYYSFPNGKRVFTTYWRCCKSSGAMALEDLPEAAYGAKDGAIAVHLYGASDASFALAGARTVHLEQATDYPFGGDVRLLLKPDHSARFTLRMRIPAWAAGAQAKVNGTQVTVPVLPGTYLDLEREWKPGDEVALQFPMAPILRHHASRNVQESIAPDGSPVEQEVMRYDYVAITRGPLVYATDLIDGFKTQETILLPGEHASALLEVLAAPAECEGPAIRLNLEGRAPLTFHPYYEAGGRKDGTWRLTWMQATPGR